MHGELKQKLDYSDLLATPDDGNRYEILEGDRLVTPPPTPHHQRVSKRLQRQLEAYFEERSMGEVFNAPIGVILAPHDVVEPDLVVVVDASQISNRGIEGAPLLIVEVSSPSTRHHDRGLKCRRYAELGVRHYWIVDPAKRSLECYRAEGKSYALVLQAEGDAIVAHPDWGDLSIDLSRLWPTP